MDVLVEILFPYFEKYHVDAYFNGHDHIQQVMCEHVAVAGIGFSHANDCLV